MGSITCFSIETGYRLWAHFKLGAGSRARTSTHPMWCSRWQSLALYLLVGLRDKIFNGVDSQTWAGLGSSAG